MIWGEDYWGELITNVVVIGPTNLGMTTALEHLRMQNLMVGVEILGDQVHGYFWNRSFRSITYDSITGDVTITGDKCRLGCKRLG